MLLSEALAERKDSLKSVSEYTEALKVAAVRYEDQEAEADAVDLAGKLEAALGQYRVMSIRINKTNNETSLVFDHQTLTLMEAVALRESLLLSSRAWKAIYEDAKEKVSGRSRYSMRRTKEDIRYLPEVPLKDLKANWDTAARQLRLLDMEIQKLNWQTELLP